MRSQKTQAFACLLISTTILNTQVLADEAVTRDEVVVTATRTPTDISRIGSSISVVTRTDIENQQTRFVIDILQTTPGLSVSQYGARGTDSHVRIRGMGTEGTLALIDGIEVSDPSRSQTAFDFSQLLTGGIDRVEVLRGSQSVLYGGQAVGGVVNIMSKRGSGDLSGSVALEAGRYSTFQGGINLMGGALEDRFGYNIDVQYVDTDGFSAADSNLPGNSEGEKYNNLSAGGRLDFSASENVDFKGAFRYAEGTLNFDACGGPFCDDSDRGDDYKQYSGRISSEFRLFDDRFTGEIGAAYARNERDGFDNGAPSYYYVGERQKYDFVGSFAINPDNILVFGAEAKKEEYVSDGTPLGASIWTKGYFALYQLTVFDALSLSFGARIEDHDNFGTFDTYRVTAAYNIDETGTKLKGSYSTGFRAPSLFELYGICCGDPMLGNANLEPEKSKSLDIGFEQSLFDSFRFELTYFRIETDNKIVYGGAFGTPDPNYFNVAGKSKSEGIEAGFVWQPTDYFSVNAAYTYNTVKSAAGTRLTYRPKHVFNGNVNYSFHENRGNFNVNMRHVANTIGQDFSVFPSALVDMDKPFVVNVAVRYKVLDNVELSARVENLLDEQYQTFVGYGTADISYYFGAKFSF